MAARQLERGDRGSVPASRTFAEIFECVRPADATRADCGRKLAYVYECAALTVGPKNVCQLPQKSLLELVEALHETDNDEQ